MVRPFGSSDPRSSAPPRTQSAAPDLPNTPTTPAGTVQAPTPAPTARAQNKGGTAAAAPLRRPTPATPTRQLSALTQRYTSPGGSIVMRRVGNTISLASTTPSAGFTQEVHDNG